MVNVEIETYWNVETLYYVFNAVAAVMQSVGFSGLLKLVFLFALGIGIFAYMGSRQVELAKWFIQALLFTTILNMSIARVTLTDKTLMEPPRTVDHVPFALAMVAQVTNLTFGYLTRTYETVFGVPDELGLRQGDVGFGHRILKQVNRATIRSPELRADLMQFFKECTIYDIKDGEITPQQIVGETGAWDKIFSHTNPARFVTYDTLSNPMKTDTCTAVAAILKDRVNRAAEDAQRYYGKHLFPREQKDHLAQGLFMSAVGTSYDWILQHNQGASDAMKQAMFNSIWKDAGTAIPVLLNDPARVAEMSALAGAAQAARQADGANSTLSLLAQETLPHMRNWIEAILYALFPVIVVMMVMVSSEGAKRMLAGYFMALAWIGLWPLLFAIINHLSLMHLQYKARGLELSKGIPFQLSDVFDVTLGNEQAMIGYMIVLVPFIAGAIIKMGQGGFLSVADRMFSGAASAGAAAGSSLASGNVSLGQTAMDTAMVNNTSMMKYDSNASLFSGGSSFGMAHGGSATIAPNGTVALQRLQNRMLHSMSMDQRFEANRQQEAHQLATMSQGSQLSYRQGQSANFTESVGTERSRGSSQQFSTQNQTSQQAGKSGSHALSHGISTTSRDESNFTTAAGAADSFGFNLGGSLTGMRNKGVAGGLSQPGKPGALRGNGSQGAMSESGSSASATFGGSMSTSKNYRADHARTKGYANQHAFDEQAREDQYFYNNDTHSVEGSRRQDASQIGRTGRHAEHSQINERSQVRDVSDRYESGVQQRVGRSESDSFNVRRDLMADPHLLEKVAASNGMSAMRLASETEESIMSMVQDYLAEKEIYQRAVMMPNQGLVGGKMLSTVDEVMKRAEAAKADIPNDIAPQYRNKASQTGFSGADELPVDTTPSERIQSTQKRVAQQMDPDESSSLPGRAANLDNNVHAWASPDKAIGEGRANPMAVVEKAEIKDAIDTFDKAVDKLKGGDGTADGEKLTDTMKNDITSRIDVGARDKK